MSHPPRYQGASENPETAAMPRRDPAHDTSELPLEQPPGRTILIQTSRLAGFRHHEAPTLWQALRTHPGLTLGREADNPHDPDAVALYWRGRKLGYLPRGENFVVARLLDRNRTLSARIERLQPKAESNHRVRVQVLMH